MKLSGATHPRPSFIATAAGAARIRSTNIASALWRATSIFLLSSIIYILASGIYDDEPLLAIIHLGSAISLLVFWKCIPWGKGRYDTFGAALLLLYACFKVQAALDALFYGNRIDEIYHTVPLPESLTWLFLKSEALNHFGILLLVAIWRQTVGIQVGQFSFINNYHQARRQLPIVIYAAAIAIEFGRRIAEQNFGDLSQFSSVTSQFGVVSIYFIASAQGSRFRQVILALLLAMPLVVLAMGSGVKSDMIFPLVPGGIIVWFRYRSVSIRGAFIIFGFLLLAYSQLYVMYVREVSWGPKGTKYTSANLVYNFLSPQNTISLHDGMNHISSRINMTVSRAITVAIADAKGFEPYNIFAPIPGSVVPRFLWPDKPVLQPGAQHTLRIHNLNWSLSEAWSATAAGFFSELYLGGGYIGWLLGVVIYATLLGRVQLLTLRLAPGFGHLALSFITFFWALRFEENHTVYAFTSIIFTFVFVVLIAKGAAILSARRQRLRINRMQVRSL
jgi:hypothetical protein